MSTPRPTTAAMAWNIVRAPSVSWVNPRILASHFLEMQYRVIPVSEGQKTFHCVTLAKLALCTEGKRPLFKKKKTLKR